MGDQLPDPYFYKNNVNVKIKKIKNGDNVEVKIILDHMTFEKARQVAYARGFSSVDRLIQSYIEEWIEYDLSYVYVEE